MNHWRNCLTAAGFASSCCHAGGRKWETMKGPFLFVAPFALYCHADGHFAEIQARQRRLWAPESLRRLGWAPPFLFLLFFISFSNLSLLTSRQIEILPTPPRHPPLWQHTLGSNKNILQMSLSWSSDTVRSGTISGGAASLKKKYNPVFVTMRGNNHKSCTFPSGQIPLESNYSSTVCFNSAEWLLLRPALISRLFRRLNCPLICVTSGAWW